MKFDLHTHTNYSDGTFTPDKLIQLAIEKELDGIAITDHDSVDALIYIEKNDINLGNLKLIPGIEFSTIHQDEEVHILGYFIDIHNENLKNISKELISSRIKRGERMIDQLQKLGLKINIEEVRELSSDNYIGRPHIARVLVKKGYSTSVTDAFDKYLNRHCPGYVERFKLEIPSTINLIKNAGGIPVLAHPGVLKDMTIINYCIESGIEGIECYHPKHDKTMTRKLIAIANKSSLIITGGSDFHGDFPELLGKYTANIDNISVFKERLVWK